MAFQDFDMNRIDENEITAYGRSADYNDCYSMFNNDHQESNKDWTSYNELKYGKSSSKRDSSSSSNDYSSNNDYSSSNDYSSNNDYSSTSIKNDCSNSYSGPGIFDFLNDTIGVAWDRSIENKKISKVVKNNNSIFLNVELLNIFVINKYVLDKKISSSKKLIAKRINSNLLEKNKVYCNDNYKESLIDSEIEYDSSRKNLNNKEYTKLESFENKLKNLKSLVNIISAYMANESIMNTSKDSPKKYFESYNRCEYISNILNNKFDHKTRIDVENMISIEAKNIKNNKAQIEEKKKATKKIR